MQSHPFSSAKLRIANDHAASQTRRNEGEPGIKTGKEGSSAETLSPGIAPKAFYDLQRCPIRNGLAPILGKWPVLVLCHLSFGEHRYSELRGALPDISERMLSKTLKSLAEENLINRVAERGMPPKVTYSLTDSGSALLPALEQLMRWSIRHMYKPLSLHNHPVPDRPIQTAG